MATIVRILASKKHYVSLGAGFGMYKVVGETGRLGSWDRGKLEGQEELLAVADAEGYASFVPIKDVRVVSIDGRTPAEILAEVGS